MNRQSIARNLVAIAAVAALAGGIACGSAYAEERHGERPGPGGERAEQRGPQLPHGGREAREVYQARHWNYDNRYQHGHYYPRPGYSVTVLPPGHVAVNFGRGRFFFHAGVWYRPGPGGYVVVRPPLGIVVPILPFGYSTLWVGGMPYYYANDIYYTGSPGNYVVATPPAADAVTVQQPAAEMPAPVGSPTAPPQAPGTWYYCESAKAYYPYVAECNEGWRPVAATPPASR